jgi:hypothetical protein
MQSWMKNMMRYRASKLDCEACSGLPWRPVGDRLGSFCDTNVYEFTAYGNDGSSCATNIYEFTASVRIP